MSAERRVTPPPHFVEKPVRIARRQQREKELKKYVLALSLLASSIVCVGAHASDTKASSSAGQKPLVFEAAKNPAPCTDGAVTTRPDGAIAVCENGLWARPGRDTSLEKLIGKMTSLQAQTLAVQSQILVRLDQLLAIEQQKAMLQPGAAK